MHLEQFVAAHVPESERYNARTACRHLGRFLKRPPELADLHAETLGGLLQDLDDGRRRPETIRRARTSVLAMCRTAAELGLIGAPPELPRMSKSVRTPYSVRELNRVFGSARTMPGEVSGLPAGEWWPALLLVNLDARVSAARAIELPAEAFNVSAGTLDTGPHLRELHPLTIDALCALAGDTGELLLPFDRTLARLYARMRLLLWRAGLPAVSRNLFERIRYTGRRQRQVLHEVDLKAPFKARPGRPRSKRRRRRRNAIPQPPTVYRLSIDSDRALGEFFERYYRPHRLTDAADATIGEHRTAIERLSWYMGVDATVDALSDDLLDAFLASLRLDSKLQPATVNGYRRCLLAQWQYAWRKRLVADQPRDVVRFREPKRLPEAWSITELSRILAAATDTPGEIGDVPAARWWPAFILALYDTGLRVNALVQLPADRFEPERGRLVVPADLQKNNADQVLTLAPETVAAIVATMPDQRVRLFELPWGVQPLRRRYRAILKRAELPHSSRDMFHRLRRTSGTAVADALGEAAAQAHLGHSSLAITKRSYLDPRNMRTTPVAELIERPAWKGGA